MGDPIRCRYCGEWVDPSHGVVIVAELRHDGTRVGRESVALHSGACLESWAPTSGSLLRSLTGRVIPA